MGFFSSSGMGPHLPVTLGLMGSAALDIGALAELAAEPCSSSRSSRLLPSGKPSHGVILMIAAGGTVESQSHTLLPVFRNLHPRSTAFLTSISIRVSRSTRHRSACSSGSWKWTSRSPLTNPFF